MVVAAGACEPLADVGDGQPRRTSSPLARLGWDRTRLLVAATVLHRACVPGSDAAHDVLAPFARTAPSVPSSSRARGRRRSSPARTSMNLPGELPRTARTMHCTGRASFAAWKRSANPPLRRSTAWRSGVDVNSRSPAPFALRAERQSSASQKRNSASFPAMADHSGSRGFAARGSRTN